MSSAHSLTALLSGAKRDEQQAIANIFTRCYQRVRSIAQKNLVGKPHRGFDEDDVANSAFREFLRRAAEGRFNKLESREDVWQILTMLVMDKVADRLRHEGRKKRGGGEPNVPLEDVAEAVSNLDDPALKAEVNDAREVLLKKLPHDDHRRVVELLQEGRTHEQIAKQLGVSVRTVDRRVEDIRQLTPKILGIDASKKKSSGRRKQGEQPEEHNERSE